MLDKVALYALAPLTFAGSLIGLDTKEDAPLQSLGSSVLVSDGGLRISRAADGLFYVPVTIGDQRIEMALDTGATRSVLPRGLLAADSISEQRRGGTIETLDGTVRFQRASLRDVKVASKHFDEIEVAVADIAFPSPLLGQDIMRELGPVTIDGDILILR